MRHKGCSLLLGLLLAGLLGSAAQAHGGTVRLNQNADPYHLTVSTSPTDKVDDLLLTVIVTTPQTEAADEQPITGATVTVTFTLSGTGAPPTVYSMPPEPVLAVQGYYERTVGILGDGDWRVTVDVSGPAGAAQGAFQIIVRTPTQTQNWLLWGAALLPVVIGVSLLIYLISTMRAAPKVAVAIDDEDDLDQEENDPYPANNHP